VHLLAGQLVVFVWLFLVLLVDLSFDIDELVAPLLPAPLA
jgi:hypothetical protein